MTLPDTQTNRIDLRLVAEMVTPGSRVLDVGCGDGELLSLLAETRGVDGRGIELSPEGVAGCVARGLSVIQGDADTDLADYPDDSFDYVILSQTIQATRNPRHVLEHMLRIGKLGADLFCRPGNRKADALQLLDHILHRDRVRLVAVFHQIVQQDQQLQLLVG